MFLNSRLALGEDIDEFPQNCYRHGQDWEGPVAEEHESVVLVDETQNPLAERDMAQLRNMVPNPLQPCSDFGLEMFVTCRDFVCQV